MAEFEQLRVGVLQQLDGGFGAGLRVVDEGGVPSDDREVVGIVGDAGLQNLLALAFGKHGGFAANDLGDLRRVRRADRWRTEDEPSISRTWKMK